MVYAKNPSLISLDHSIYKIYIRSDQSIFGVIFEITEILK